jgi:xanthine dehydrogenase molybdenum-binding subunit
MSEKQSKEPTQGPDRKPYRVIGTRPIRHDGVDKVTGRALYGADMRLPGMLYGAVLRSPHAHARILSIDTSRAAAFPGVKAVITGKDFPQLEDKIKSLGEGAINLRYQSHNVMAFDKALYYGHAVAAVAASSPHTAAEALALIDVQYELLPPVMNVDQALLPDAPILLPELRTRELDVKGEQPTNLASHYRIQRGDLEAGFGAASVIIERQYDTSTVHQGYIEPQNATALWNRDGRISVWTSTQDAFGERDQLADILQVPVSSLRVTPMEIGGGFGGKIGVYLEPVAALLSLKSGHRPVKLAMPYNEVLAATGPTSGSVIKVKIGADSLGKITAAQVEMYYEAGAFPGSPVGSGMGVILGPYRIQNLQIDGYDVVVNKPRAAAYRAPGGTNAAFAGESAINELADKLGIDPLQFRQQNGAKMGDLQPWGPPYPKIGYLETVEAALQYPHYHTPLTAPNTGRGVASGYWGNYGGKSSASASVNADGTVNLVEGSTDIGGSRVALAMQLAETLGITAEEVKPLIIDTDSVGYTEGTYGSRTTFATGWAAYQLGCDLSSQLIERAAILWEVDPQQVEFDAGQFICGERQMSFKELAARLDETGSPVSAAISVRPETEGPGFATHIVDVEVDPETGKVRILRYTAVQDVGTAIHPSYVEGQIQGGVTQGIGWALNEGYFYDESGHLLNASLLDYRLPTSLDLPMIDPVLVEVPNPGHPYGVRGVGEVPIVPPAAAIAEAIYQAVGVRLTTLPMSPAVVLEALWAADPALQAG